MRAALVLLAACGATEPAVIDGAIPDVCTTTRSEVDLADDSDLDQIRALYVITSDGPDFAHDTDGSICNSLRAAATWFHDQTGQFLRFDTVDGALDIGFARLPRTDAQMHGTDPGNHTIEDGHAFVRDRIERELVTAPNKLYAVFYEGTSSYACGAGAYPPLIPGRVGTMYLRAMPPGQAVPCGDSYPWGQPSLVPGYVDYAILHELVHSLGFVRETSPHQHTTGHVFDLDQPKPGRDLMYSPRLGMPDPFWDVLDPDGLLIDLGNDDYYGTGAADDLAASSLLAPLPVDAHRPDGW